MVVSSEFMLGLGYIFEMRLVKIELARARAGDVELANDGVARGTAVRPICISSIRSEGWDKVGTTDVMHIPHFWGYN